MCAVADVERVLESGVEDLGFELVDVRWGGSGQRRVLRVRIDRVDSTPENRVTVGNCPFPWTAPFQLGLSILSLTSRTSTED